MAFDMQILVCLLFILVVTVSAGYDDNVLCLKSIKESLEDPEGILTSSWNFDNISEGTICRFSGVECWHPEESRVLNINLNDMGLGGSFPRGLSDCTSLTFLDLSNNRLSGMLPSDISSVLGSVVNLDLSSNNFSGEIPADFENCTYLNNLNLDNNQFQGRIPGELGGLKRLKSFSVANNHLSGPVPDFAEATSVTKDNYADNNGLSSCIEHRNGLKEIIKNDKLRFICGFIVGWVVSALVSLFLGLFCLPDWWAGAALHKYQINARCISSHAYMQRINRE
ncbi:hypothetical protein LIER_09455 [Lithospermum erythrorhizon]|uniref:Leucine-rich repeat-containing N-terminal plant-type domain-containing protein n=1 Tax=Lithospermum erythrorhizon TaxID=34254 RepID=A0AAV3PFP6_LITER